MPNTEKLSTKNKPQSYKKEQNIMAWKKPNMLDYQNDNLYQEFIKHFNWEKASIIDYAYNKQCKKDV